MSDVNLSERAIEIYMWLRDTPIGTVAKCIADLEQVAEILVCPTELVCDD